MKERFVERRGSSGNVRPHLFVVAFMAVLCLLFFWRIITPGLSDRGSFPAGDFTDQFYSFAMFEARELGQGRLPLWNPYTYAGHPFLADIQSAIFYPVSLLTLFFSAMTGGFTMYALELEAIFHFLLVGVFTYLFAWRLIRRRWPAVVSALVFTYGGYLTSYPLLQLAVLEADTWLPLILLLLDVGMERAGQGRRNDWPWFVGAGVFLGISFLAGHGQSGLYLLYMTIIYAAFRAYTNRCHWRRAVVLSLIVLTVGFGVGAAQLVPSTEFLIISNRATASYSKLSGGFPFIDALQLLLPGSVTLWSPLYIGILPLLLALFAGLFRREREVWFWGGLALFAFVLSFGGNTFLFVPLYLIAPGFNLFKSQERSAFFFSFAMAILAGYGTLVLGRGIPRSLRARFHGFVRFAGYLLVGSVAFFFLTFHAWLGVERDPASPFNALTNQAGLLALLLCLSFILLTLRQRGVLRGTGLMASVVALVIFDLFTVNWEINFSPLKPEEHYPPLTILQPIQTDPGTFRTYNEWRLPPNYGDVYEVEEIWGSSPLRLARYEELLEKLPMARVWQLLNVKYVITWRKTLVPESEILYQEPVTSEDITYLHRLKKVWPRVYVVNQAIVAEDDQQALQLLAEPEFDPLEMVVLEKEPPFTFPSSSSSEPASVQLREWIPGRMVWDVEHDSDGLLVFSELYYPGWRARVNGEEVEILQADYILMAVPVATGSHQVELIFDPLSVKLGMGISGITLLVVAALLVLAWRGWG